MIEISKQIQKFAQKHLSDSAECQAFLDAVRSGRASDKAVLWMKEAPTTKPWPSLDRVSWQPEFVDRVAADVKPGLDALHQAGAYYCLDFSSVFSASSMLSLGIQNPRLLDMCASPGGKSVFAWRALKPEILIANEVIGKRSAALISNLRRCGLQGALVTRNDSSVWAQLAPRAFDVVLADAPCSGQSLLAKGDSSPGCFHPATINMNANRQKRILINSQELLAPEGVLIYMTCTYSKAENEAVVEWLKKKTKTLIPQEVPHLAAFQSKFVDFPCYRLWPQSGLGAGAFVAVLKQEITGQSSDLDLNQFKSLEIFNQ